MSFLSFLAALAMLLASVHAAPCECNANITHPIMPTDAPTLVTKLIAVFVRLAPDTSAIPHSMAVVAASMYDALALKTPFGYKSLSNRSPSLLADVDQDEAIAYAAYAAMKLVFAPYPEKLLFLDGFMSRLNTSSEMVMEHPSADIARAIAAKYRLLTNVNYIPPNPPSSTFDANCSSITDPNGWQPQCVQSTPGAECMPQEPMFVPFFDAGLVTANGEQNVNDIIQNLPSPPSTNMSLSDLSFTDSSSEFADQYMLTLNTSAHLDDYQKAMAEFFAPNAALRVASLLLDELVVRELSDSEALQVFLATAAATRDALVATVTLKLGHGTIRPVTVIQCGFGGRPIRAWKAPHQGVSSFVNGENGDYWRPYLQTPAFPGFVSGHSAVSAAGAYVMKRFFGNEKPRGANCYTMMAGMSKVEGRIEKGVTGFSADVTNVANSGPESVGYSPAKDVLICWPTWKRFAEMVAKSREYGGIHIPVDNEVGLMLGQEVANRSSEFVMSLISVQITNVTIGEL